MPGIQQVQGQQPTVEFIVKFYFNLMFYLFFIVFIMVMFLSDATLVTLGVHVQLRQWTSSL